MEIKQLKNGIRVATYKNDNSYSATIGVWFKVGSINESKENSGISHFIEHMMFKGTTTKTAKDIAFSMDCVGGIINAFTSKECTCYNATVTYEHIGTAVKLLADMIKNSLIDDKELAKEKGVILEEINMTEDSPEDVIHSLHAKTFFDGHVLSNSVIGSKETVSSLYSSDLKEYIANNYTGDRIVISVAGRFDEQELYDLIEKEFSNIKNSDNNIEVYPKIVIPNGKKTSFKQMKIEQTHICLGFPGMDLHDKDLYSLYVLSNLLGGSMSSRLFQSIREDKGLSYTIFSYASAYINSGMFSIYSATNPSQVKELVDIALKEVRALRKSGPTKEEINMAKEQMKGNYILGIEGTGGRMTSMGKSLLLIDKINSPEEILARIDSITYDTIMNMIPQVLDEDKLTATFVGKVDENEVNSYIN